MWTTVWWHKKWGLNFNFWSIGKLIKIAAWIRTSRLPDEFYYAQLLCRIGTLVGKTIKVDPMTSLTTRDRFALICMEINLKRQFFPHFSLKGKVYKIEYEGLELTLFQIRNLQSSQGKSQSSACQ